MTGALQSDRRPAPRGDVRRAALLEALDEVLRESGGDLEPVNIADISARAGVTRSAFYFYFENLPAAVAAVSQEMYDEILSVTDVLVGQGPPRERITTTIHGLVDIWDRHRHLYRALLEAHHSSPGVRGMWETGRRMLAERIAEMIEAERAAGTAPPGPDAVPLATVLLDLNENLLERLTYVADSDATGLADATIAIWLRSVHGHLDPSIEGTPR
ncbi:TetR/AcrR family transcriptional regulator [Nocardioides pacificus]